MMYAKKLSQKLIGPAWAALALLLLAGAPAGAQIIEVCATCTHTDLESAFAVATGNDTIVLDGPDTYTLAAGLTVNAARSGLTIRGLSTEQPNDIVVEYTGTGPVITVDEDVNFTAVGFTISGGDTGILALENSVVAIDRCLIENASGVGVDCANVSSVTLRSTVITGCGGAATHIDLGGSLNIIQCTFLTNGSFGVDAVAGLATVEATLIHDSDDGTNGISGTAATLRVDGNWVTDAAGNLLPLPTGVTDANPITDPLDPAVVFDAAGYPGKIAPAELRRTGAPATFLTASTRDFANLARNTTDLAVGVDEVAAFGVGGPEWTECYVIQRGLPRRYVGEGGVTVRVVTPGIDLSTATLFIGHSDPGISVLTEFLGPYPLQVGTVETAFGYVDLTILEENFVAAFPSAASVQEDFFIYIDTSGSATPSAPTLLGTPEGTGPEPGNQAVLGRIFALDTIPPQIVTDFNLLANQYLVSSVDNGEAIDPGGPWNPTFIALMGNVGANAGHLNGTAGDPQVFFSSLTTMPLTIGVRVTFTDVGSGFETEDMPITATSTGLANADLLYVRFRDTYGLAYWDENGESQELLEPGVNLEVTYENPGGNELTATWTFSNLNHLVNQHWHAIANIRVTDLAGNEATLDPTFQSYIPLKPFHMWWFPDYELGVSPGAVARITSGPSGAEDADPRFTWGIDRQGGSTPRDPYPAVSAARWRIWGANAPGTPGTSWTAISPGWSAWLDPLLDGVITLDTYFNATTTMRQQIAAAGGGPGDEYLIAVMGYDEAGNMQEVPPLGNLTSVADLSNNPNFPPLAFNRWTDPGADMALGLDTRVQPIFWHNRTNVGDLREIDGGERVFGAVSRIPLPDPGCLRVEGAFTVDLDLPSSAANSIVRFELLEDGRTVVWGERNLGGARRTTFVFPEHIINPLGADALGSPSNPLDFLNMGSPDFPCGGVRDRLGDDGDETVEPPYRQRDVKYLVRFSAGYDPGTGLVFDTTPATVEFTVTTGTGASKATEQAIKSFRRE